MWIPNPWIGRLHYILLNIKGAIKLNNVHLVTKNLIILELRQILNKYFLGIKISFQAYVCYDKSLGTISIKYLKTQCAESVKCS